MKQSIARVLRRLANQFDPTPNSQHVAAQDRVAKAQWDLAAALQREHDVYERFASRGRDASELFTKSWHTKITEGLVPPFQFPKLPNAAGVAALKAPWWRRLLRRFGR